MKRIALFFTGVAALAVSTTTSSKAADHCYGHGYVDHTSPSHRYAASGHRYAEYGRRPRHYYNVGHGCAVPCCAHGAEAGLS